MEGLSTTLGSGAMTNSIAEIDTMGPGDTLFTIGTNTTACHPIIGIAMLRALKRGVKLIAVDPRATTLTQHADVWLRLNLGSDVALLNGLANVILQNGWEDTTYIAEHTEGFAHFKKIARNYSPEKASKITGVPAKDIEKAAELIGTSNNVAIYYNMGITQHTSGVDNVMAVSNIAILTGNLGRPKTGINPLRGQNNVQGACDMGALPDVLPGYQKVHKAAIQKKFAKAWGCEIPTKEGLKIPSVLEGIEKDEIKAVYVFGENPLRSDPDINHVTHCLKKVELLIVQDIFLTETAAIADVVLPGTTFAEKDGTFTSTERRVQRVRKAVEASGQCKPDWLILSELMETMGYPASYSHPQEIFDEMRQLVPAYTGITYERLENESLQWPCPTTDHPGTPVLHVGGSIRGKARFVAADYRPPAELPDADYPLALTTGRVVAHYHTGTMTRRCWGLRGVAPYEEIEIHPSDATTIGIVNGETVRVSSRRGEVQAVAQVTTRVTPGLVFMTFHYAESSANMLTNSACDPITKTPEFKVCAVAVHKINDLTVHQTNIPLKQQGKSVAGNHLHAMKHDKSKTLLQAI
ncbi:MAG: formate dehydrogenase major subunit [Desulforhopalus sp.]